MNSATKKRLLPLLGLLVLGKAPAEIYKWFDSEGKVHFSDRPPATEKAEKLGISTKYPKTPGTTPSDFGHPPSALPAETLTTPKKTGGNSKNLSSSSSLKELGPLPKNSVSKYLKTTNTWVSYNWKKHRVKFHLTLKARNGLPFGAYLEAHFDNPQNPGSPIVVGKVRLGGQQEITLSTPEVEHVVCHNYSVLVLVYDNKDKHKLLGKHHQVIQSRINIDEINSARELIEGLRKGGACR